MTDIVVATSGYNYFRHEATMGLLALVGLDVDNVDSDAYVVAQNVVDNIERFTASKRAAAWHRYIDGEP